MYDYDAFKIVLALAAANQPITAEQAEAINEENAERGPDPFVPLEVQVEIQKEIAESLGE